MTIADPRPVIAGVRDGRGLDKAGATLIARGLADGSVSDAQAGAFAMATLLAGLGEEGRVALTCAMRDSGRVLRWDLSGPVVDKHSTGGIGDTVSLVLAPVLAACGAYVPMISGRGLGHTGGTLDKLEAIPGFRTALPEDGFRNVVAHVGCAIVAAGPDLAPADARLYAIRDESATVGSIDLITASILSKKLAAGLDALVLDVKQGSGAFLRSPEAALDLARTLVRTANGAGCLTRACVTDMDQPLARAAGNALELREAMAVLSGGQGALADLSLALSQSCLSLVGLDGAEHALISGAAAERFARMVAAQGGPTDLLERPDAYLPPAPVIRPIPAAGRVAAIDTAALGHAVVALGGGRLHAADHIDPRVGLADLLRIGQEAGDGRPLGFVHAASEAAADAAVATVQAAYLMGDGPEPGPLIRCEVSPE
ncbi:thymidine phosphorylase [Paracoccus aestuariivivens]|uniref:thymidine phosphorylase n=1 Tax=Paracoccus aestuariivivens TaxID=1820333 RepID=A0A6L6J683_9RHOB|nr:thymidine phosphorylase [Paracoccus aestuariivivens]MTH76239.1 thymidine phosphorylase [Paracoccus aestuariivivens]